MECQFLKQVEQTGGNGSDEQEESAA